MRRVRLLPPAVPDGVTRAYAWWRVGISSARDRWCFSCAKTIPAGKLHARDDNGRRLCQVCVEASEVDGEQSPTEVNRRQRHGKIERAQESAVRFLLDGLGVRTIRDLKALVDEARPSAERRFMVDRAGAYSAAVGMARLALQQGDPEKAARVLDDAVDKIHRQHFDACVEDGYPPEKVELLLGPRDRDRSRNGS